MPATTQNDVEEIRGTIEHVIYASDGFAVLRLDDGTAAVGSILRPREGLEYTFRGRREAHARYGEQFKFSTYTAHLPTASDAIEAYLREHCPGVGAVLAKRIVSTLGGAALERLKADPVAVSRLVPRLKAETAQAIGASLREIEADEALELRLKELLSGTKISKRAIKAIKAKWGHMAPDVIVADPFSLTEWIDGVGFATADAISENLGLAKDSPTRIQAGIRQTLLDGASEGHVCLPLDVTVYHATELLVVQGELVSKQIEALLLSGGLVARARSEGIDLYLPSLYRDEKAISQYLLGLLQADPRVPAGELAVDGLAADQVAALEAAARSPVFLLTGAPGTGKTYTVKKILETFPTARVALAAPTGKAARRLSEQTGLPASTVHKLLGPQKDPKGNFIFTKGPEDPLEADLIVLDEVSMLDTSLAARFLSAVPAGARLILVGDDNQLPSVGPGNVLRELLASKVIPSVELTVIKRQNPGLIVTNCHRIKDGKDLEVQNGPGADLVVLERDDPQEIRETILDLVSRRLPAAYKCDPIREIQVISPRRTGVELSCTDLNPDLQDRIVPGPGVSWTHFRIGDKVLQLKNDVLADINGEQVAVCNGDFGVVQELLGDAKEKKIRVSFDNPIRIVDLPSKDNLDLDLAWACTVHKFQGSECKIVVIPVHRSAGGLILQRNLIYTAISRARELCILVGQPAEISKAISRKTQVARKTNLARILQEGACH